MDIKHCNWCGIAVHFKDKMWSKNTWDNKQEIYCCKSHYHFNLMSGRPLTYLSLWMMYNEVNIYDLKVALNAIDFYPKSAMVSRYVYKGIPTKMTVVPVMDHAKAITVAIKKAYPGREMANWDYRMLFEWLGGDWAKFDNTVRMPLSRVWSANNLDKVIKKGAKDYRSHRGEAGYDDDFMRNCRLLSNSRSLRDVRRNPTVRDVVLVSRLLIKQGIDVDYRSLLPPNKIK